MDPLSGPNGRHAKDRHRGEVRDRPVKPAGELVSIGYIHNGTVRQEFMRSLIDLYIYDTMHCGRFLRLIDALGPYIANSRNAVVKAFLADDHSDWLLFLDNDMVFEPNIHDQLWRLADPVERPIVAGMYITAMMAGPDEVRDLPTWLHTIDGEPLRQVRTVDFEDELVPLDGCGMGCTIIHRSALEAVWDAHSDDQWPCFGHDLAMIDEEVGPVRCGEDITFCRRLAALGRGFSIWGAPRVQAGHVKSRLISVSDVAVAIELGEALS